jgi:hypothetical protein
MEFIAPTEVTYAGRAFNDVTGDEVILPRASYPVEDKNPEHGDTAIWHDGAILVIPGTFLSKFNVEDVR